MPGITYTLAIEVDGRLPRGLVPRRVGIVFGQNDDVAWSLTNTMADVMDLYVERIDGDEYEFRDERLPVVLTEEEIVVKGRSEPERLLVRSTHHGPIVNEALRRARRAAGAAVVGARRSLRHPGEPRRCCG